MIGRIEWGPSNLNGWQMFNDDNKAVFYESLAHVEIPRLRYDWSVILAQQLVPQRTFEQDLRQLASCYLTFVRQLDEVICQFNELHPPSALNWDNREEAFKEFLAAQVETEAFSFITQMPMQSEMKNLEIFAQYPC